MIDLTDFQTAWSEYYSISQPHMDLFVFMTACGALAMIVKRVCSGAGFKEKVSVSLATFVLIVGTIAFVPTYCKEVMRMHDATKPDSFGTVISKRYGLGSLSCKVSGSTNNLYMKADIPSSGNYDCTGHDANNTDHIYTDLTLVVDGNKVGLYDKDGNLFKAGER